MHIENTTPRHGELRMAIILAMKPFDDIPVIEQLAILSFFLGQYVAFQDSSRYTPAGIMAMVASNVELGNASALTDVAMGVVKLKP